MTKQTIAAVEKYVGAEDLTALYRRSPTAKKGDSGKVLIIAGGAYTGAPALAGMAALRTGCDIVSVAAPAGIYEVVASFSPDLIVKKLSTEMLSEGDKPILKELIQAHDVVIIGPGLGKEPPVLKTAAELIPDIKKAVIDADALRPEMMEALEKRANKETEIIVTPHYGEFCRLAEFCGIKTASKKEENTASELEKYAAEMSEKLNVTVLLKGAPDLICGGKENIRYNSTGNSGMTVGGTGDVLAGIVGGLLAKNAAFESACCGAFVCGRAGDLAFKKYENSLIPSDLLKRIPKALRFEKKQKLKKT